VLKKAWKTVYRRPHRVNAAERCYFSGQICRKRAVGRLATTEAVHRFTISLIRVHYPKCAGCWSKLVAYSRSVDTLPPRPSDGGRAFFLSCRWGAEHRQDSPNAWTKRVMLVEHNVSLEVLADLAEAGLARWRLRR
jgi:hypothetical protein